MMKNEKEFGNQTGALFGEKGEKKKGGSEIGYAVIIAVVIMLLRACVSLHMIRKGEHNGEYQV